MLKNVFFLKLMSPKMSDLGFTDAVREVFSHSFTEGGDVCTLP